MHYLVTGGAGYIGSHICLELKARSHEVTVLDDFSSGHRWAVAGLEVIEADLRDLEGIRPALAGRRFDGVFHLAAKSLVGESAQKPLYYYQNNVSGTANLITVALEEGGRDCVFSSTAAVYGNPLTPLIAETHPLNPINVYGQTKRVMEELLAAVHAQGDLNAACLRYFNAAGASPEDQRGEWHEPETHLIPNILRGAAGDDVALTLYGDDYPTPDGTCIRDYVHVLDLADAHVRAMELLHRAGGFHQLNLGNGQGYSVKEVLAACERAVGASITHTIGPRRAGDPARLVAEAQLAEEVLGWTPSRGLQAIVESAWAWEQHRRQLKHALD